ncbi:hypothetical protein PENSPDRAFT_655824 [Peniophora sp. CONT]|nr:hypothetical protein PENSPDRAFT_655824 [Peniophora sp. CONT]
MSRPPHEEQHRQAAMNAWSSLVNTRLYGHHVPTDMAISSLRAADTELYAMQECFAAARKQRNFLIGACKLPVELLGYIFQLLRVTWKPARWKMTPSGKAGVTGDWDSTTRYTSGWISVTHVCSIWRQVSVNNPTLWRDIDCRYIHPRCIDTILIRSKAQPLRLNMHLHLDVFDQRDHGSEVRLREPICTRLDVLTLTIVSYGSEPTDPLALALPNLSELTLSLVEPEKYPSAKAFTSQYPPKLRRLDITDYVPQVASTLLAHSLTSLKLRRTHDIAHEHLLTVSRLSRILLRLPNLQTIGLANVLKLGTRDHALQPFTVSSCLKQISIVSREYEAVATLIGRAVLPPSTSVTVNALNCELPDTALRIAEVMFRESIVDRTQTQEIVLARNIARLFPWHSSNSLPRGESFLPGMPEVTIDTRSRGYRVLRLTAPDEDVQSSSIEDVVAYLPLSSATAIAFASEFEFVTSAASWISTFSAARNVLHIYLSSSFELDLLCAALEERSENQEFVLFPHLETITLDSWDMRACPHPHPGMVALASSLICRSDGGSPIREVRAKKSSESWMGEEWDRIRGLVELSFMK